ncbi:spore coat protein [Effusibacillus pohliae]|uniref:spore coat protein n=1 Tax=Effusibacillus pohliae TaxID=232270 RepID=UPI00038133AD|nr:spore coat protein [Effusibacillus pohliae]
MAANLGAHEVMELHEVLTDAIDGINQFQLYRPHVQDPQLRQILDKQIQFMTQEYNSIVQALQQQGAGQAVPYRTPRQANVQYGLQNPATVTPNASANQMDDRDVASGMLGCHKASACTRMVAALEFANPQLRRMVQQSAVNCAEQAYEVWQYMNQKGYYQVPTMQQTTTNTMLHTYGAAPMGNMGGMAAAGQANQQMASQQSPANPQYQ